MIHQEVIGLQQHIQAIARLRELGARTGQIDAIYKRAAKPFVGAMKSQIPVRSSGQIISYYKSRIHPPGTLRRSIMLKKSKFARKIFWIGSISKRREGRDTYYSDMFISGSKGGIIGTGRPEAKAAYINGRWVRTKKRIGGFSGHNYVDRAWSATSALVYGIIDDGFYDLANREWKR